jgi:rod shape-determining protein MreD
LTLPFAALVALFAAVLETSVFAELPLAGATVDLVLVCAAVATIVLGVEDGLVLGFIGGLLLDMVVASRPMGAATLAMLLTLGIAFLVSRALSGTRRLAAVGLVLILTAVYHVLFVVVMVITANSPFRIDVTAILIAAVINAVIAIPVAWLFGAVERRFGATDRADWSTL